MNAKSMSNVGPKEAAFLLCSHKPLRTSTCGLYRRTEQDDVNGNHRVAVAQWIRVQSMFLSNILRGARTLRLAESFSQF